MHKNIQKSFMHLLINTIFIKKNILKSNSLIRFSHHKSHDL
jgi:hypothetical protein